MAISLNSVVGFNSKLQARSQHASKSLIRSSAPRFCPVTFPLGTYRSWKHTEKTRWGSCLSVADRDQLATKSTTNDVSGYNQVSAADSSFADAPRENSPLQVSDKQPGSQTSEPTNAPGASPNLKEEVSSSTTKRSPLTARERLRAARVLNRYAESKPSKSEMGSKVLNALRESDGGKRRSGLPEAPTNLFDDSKRGLPKPGLTFQFPGGSDLFFIIFSFVFISTVMFTTTYIVWKAGAIHFNEY